MTFAEASRADYSGLGLPRILLNWPSTIVGTFSGVAGIYQRHRYAKVRETFELWSQHIETLTTKKAAAA